jgi:hypothetical protein
MLVLGILLFMFSCWFPIILMNYPFNCFFLETIGSFL